MKIISLVYLVILIALINLAGGADYGPINMREGANITLNGGTIKNLQFSDSIVKISGSNYVAINSTGHKIIESADFSDVMGLIQAYSENIFVSDGSYTVDALTTINRSVILSDAATLVPGSDIDMFELHEGGKLSGGTIDTSGITYTKNAITISGDIDSYDPTGIKGMTFIGAANSGTAIYMVANDSTYGYIYGVTVDGVRFKNMEYGIKKYVDSGPSGNNWINGNKFTNLWGDNTKYFLYESQNASSGGSQAIGGNTYDFDYQKSTNSTAPCFTFLGTGNHIFARVWDWDAASIMRFEDGGNYLITTLESSDIDTVTGINQYVFWGGTEHGIRRITVGPDAGMFHTLEDAFENITPTWNKPYYIEVIEPTWEYEPVIFDSNVHIEGHGNAITYVRTGTATAGFWANQVSNLTINDLDLVYDPSSANSYACYIYKCANTTLDNVRIINKDAGLAGLRGLHVEGSSARFLNCRFYGGGTGGHGVVVSGATSPNDSSLFRDCYADGAGTGYGFYFENSSVNLLYDCVGFSDTKGRAFGEAALSAATFSGCLNKTGTSTYTAYS